MWRLRPRRAAGEEAMKGPEECVWMRMGRVPSVAWKCDSTVLVRWRMSGESNAPCRPCKREIVQVSEGVPAQDPIITGVSILYTISELARTFGTDIVVVSTAGSTEMLTVPHRGAI